MSQDFAQYDGTGDGRGLHTGTWDQTRLDIISDITSIPEPDASFDAIMCTEVFEHLPDPIRAIQEFSRLLKPDGILIITAPFCSLTHFAPYHFYSGFNRYFYEKYLKENGFEILEITENGNFFEYLAQEMRRIRSISKQYAHDSPSLIETYALHVILKMLARFSGKDQGSKSLLTFGFHIFARKSN